MKKMLFVALLAAFTCSISFATIRRVGYPGSATNIDYTTGDLAVTAAITGDTIMIYPAGSSGFSFTNINKKLVFIGTGYYNYPGANNATNYNANLQNAQPSSSCSFSLYPGSDGTIMTGLDMTAFTYGTASINNVKITNCRLGYVYFQQPYTYDNWEISKCEVYSTGIYSANASAKITNIKVFNCIFSGAGINIENGATGQTGIVENCTFYGGSSLYILSLKNSAYLVQNCIFYSSSMSNYSNTLFNNNIFTSSPSPAVVGANNITGANSAILFVGVPTQATYSNDERFKLRTGSPAIGAGIGGIDCGAFGGVNPYKLSGIPAVPAIYKLTAPTSGALNNPYTITFSIRANN